MALFVGCAAVVWLFSRVVLAHSCVRALLQFFLRRIFQLAPQATPPTRDNNEASRVSRAKYMYAHLKLHYSTLCPHYGTHVCPSIRPVYA